MAVHEAAAIAVGAVLRALIADGFYAERDLADALRLAAVAVTELPNSMVPTPYSTRSAPQPPRP